jgi:tetratricopeptide (TPR) repeat protein
VTQSNQELTRQLNAAANRLQSGDPTACIEICDRLLKERPGLLQAHYLRGMAAVQTRQPPLAASDLREVHKRQPGNLHAALFLGRSLRQLERYEEAIPVLRAAMTQKQFETDARYELARCHTRLRDHDQAALQYRKVLELYPRHADAAANLAFLSERENKLAQARKWAARALEIAPRNTMAQLTMATVQRRNGQERQAIESLREMLTGPLSPVNRSVALNQLGQCFDRLADYPSAFDAYSQSNELLKRNHPYGRASDEGSYGTITLGALRRWLSANPPHGWSHAPPADAPAPVFLVGFPRSGTTLLDRALSAHPQVEVLEELELMDEVRRDWVDEGALARLPDLSGPKIQEARNTYLRAMERNRLSPERPVVVDKLPLNLAYLFLIHRLFPSAKVLFMLRDPRDASISCYFQSFDLQGAMPYFLDLGDTVAYYDAVMALALDSFSAMGNPQLPVRYEKLVTEFEPQMRQIVSYLGLDWTSDILDYRSVNHKRRVDTPSYQQVVQPLYTRSIGRWRNYREQLELVLPRLGPWIERFGYAD